ncbi:facilitated trehalose transporter Tret1-like [Trichogramma pretiosum]|uniref:facilitated trehalose transporter Tret1-like n=1 Tax=Trichogramma pretiosum TaxID=7493 RepID=UPI000C719B0C|nr:facilitated trehalose transporter Tret1-like [Trichogramma pretiosum]
MILGIGKNIIYPQWIAGAGVNLLLIHIGVMGAWTSPTLAKLAESDSPIKLSVEQASWVASFLNLTRCFGGIIGPVCVNYLGSKKSILITLCPILLGWLLITLSDSFVWLYFSRLFSGLGLGMTFSVFPLYIGEVSIPSIRGALISLATLGAPVGQILATLCGSQLSVNEAAYVYLFLAIVTTALFFWLPESPHHLVKMKKHDAARESIQWYRAGQGVDDELVAVIKFVTTDGDMTFKEKLQRFKTSKPLQRATAHIMALYTFVLISGSNVMMMYMEPILRDANFNLTDPSLFTVYINVIATVAAIGSIFLIDKCGRKFLLLVSSIGLSISLIGVMTFFILVDLNVDTVQWQWLPGVSLLIYMVSFFIGLLPVPNAILSEIFPANVRSVASCIAVLTAAFMSFVSIKSYQPMIDAMGHSYVFLIYAICTVAIIPYSIFLLPETKGKSLQQIQDELMTH